MRDEFKPYCYGGSVPSIVINKRDRLTVDQWEGVLRRIRATIESEPLRSDDDTTPGNKSTTCNWGACSDRREHYPTPELHQFPQDFADVGRVSSLQPPEGHHCPMRKTGPADTDSERASGCFWQCRVFQRRHKTPTREQAVRLFDAALEGCTEKREGASND